MTHIDKSAAIKDDVPWSDEMTEYDETHFAVYLRLLDACAEGAKEDVMCEVVLGIDPVKEPDRARCTLASHLRRARWMTERGYQHLLR